MMDTYKLCTALLLQALLYLSYCCVTVASTETKENSKYWSDTVEQDGEYPGASENRLDWTKSGNNFIIRGRNGARDITVNYLKPHPRNTREVNANRVYMGFSLYKVDGKTMEANTGIFHFVDIQNIRSYSCPRPTNHASAYRYFEGKCPEQSTGIVASGYCIQRNFNLVFNSFTFNSHIPETATYMDTRYYQDDTRVVHPLEQGIIQFCFNGWRNDNFNSNFRCDVKRAQASLKTKRSLQKRATGGDCGCDVPCTGVSTRPLASILKVWISCLFVMSVKYIYA